MIQREAMIRMFSELIKSTIPLRVAKKLVTLKSDVEYLQKSVLGRNSWRERENSPPVSIGFDITDVCNARCVFCAYQFTRPSGPMSMKIFRRSVKEAARLDAKVVSLSPLTGEPLLDPYFFNRLRLSREYSWSIVLFTNGILLRRVGVEKLLNSGITDMSISVMGFDERRFCEIARAKGYKEMMAGISELLELNKKLGNPIKITLFLRTGRKLWEDLNQPDFRQYIAPSLTALDSIRGTRTFDNWCGLIGQDSLPEGIVLAERPHLNRRPCEITFSLCILNDGKVRLCNCRFGKRGKHDDLLVGDVQKESLEGIWWKKAKEVRCRFLRGALPDPCRKCSLYHPA